MDVTTVQGWESGRRPLAAMNAGDFLHLGNRLCRLGAPAPTGRHLREAIEADHVLSTGVTAGDRWVDADTHPLAGSCTGDTRELDHLADHSGDSRAPEGVHERTEAPRACSGIPVTRS